MTTTDRRGFTLIELLVVIAIIGILASVVLASLNTAREKSRDAKRISDVKQVQLALELYFDSCGQYPVEGASDAFPASAEATGCTGSNNWGTYMNPNPTNPSGSTPGYLYRSFGTGAVNYVLSATMEDDGHTIFGSDVDGTIDTTFDCTDANNRYCVQP